MTVFIEGSDWYQSQIYTLLSQIIGRKTGNVVYKIIEKSSDKVVVESTDDTDNANANTHGRRFSRFGQSGTIIEYYPNTLETRVKPITLIGDETFKPETVRRMYPGFLADEILMHELVHAARGTLHGWRHLDDDAVEEFYAVLVGNIYLSEKGSKAFRSDHGFGKLPEEDAAPGVFLDKNFGLINGFCLADGKLTAAISNINTPFNPLRDYYERMTPVTKEQTSDPRYAITSNVAPVITLPGSLFDTAKAIIKNPSDRALHQAGAVIRSKGGSYRVFINGYTDNAGEGHYDNKALSLLRAQVVKEWFGKNGYLTAPANVFANGYGAESPVASNKTEATRQLNRRVEIVMVER